LRDKKNGIFSILFNTEFFAFPFEITSTQMFHFLIQKIINSAASLILKAFLIIYIGL